MVKYSCEKCGKEFDQKSHYKQHTNKKNPCVYSSKLQEYIEGIVEKKVRQVLKELRDNKKIRVIDLFCGCGGLTQGLAESGLDIVAGIDIWDRAIESYKANHNHIGLCKDLTKYGPKELEIELEKIHIKKSDIDMIVGGPPCQGFSVAGKRLKDDPRNKLYKIYLNMIKYYNPTAVI